MDPHAICLALNMFFEARDQGVEGMLMVADVTMERVADARYPDTICEVVWQRKQFSWTHDGLSDDPDRYDTHYDRMAWVTAKSLAEDVIDDRSNLPGSGATHYHAKRVSPDWASSLTLIGSVGDHVFYAWE